MSSSTGKKSAKVARAATRYRPGKAPKQIGLGETYSSEEDERDPIDIQQQTQSGSSIQANTTVTRTGNELQIFKPVEVRLQEKADTVLEREDQSSEYETDTDEEPVIPTKAVVGKPNNERSNHTAASSEYETDSESDESMSEDDRPQLVKPIFKPKNQRVSQSEQNKSQQQFDNERAAQDRAIQESDLRRKQSHALAAERIRQELQEKEHEQTLPDISDTDEKDPEGEFAAWRIRELSRIKRERDRMRAKEDEKGELERRRAMPEEERLKEDFAKASASRKEKEEQKRQNDQQGFMQKYYHKGSFFQDMDILKQRDYSSMTESATDKKSLPEIMQVRDYGKKGRSKWTHLKNEDTTRSSHQDSRFKGMSGAKNR